MVALKYLLMILGVGLFGSSGILVAYDIYIAARLRWLLEQTSGEPAAEAVQRKAARPFGPVRWRLALQLAAVGIVPVLVALSIVVVPDGTAVIRVSQLSGVRPGTLYPGVHLVTPLVDDVVLYDTREQVYTTSANAGNKARTEILTVQAREELKLGLAVSVRMKREELRTQAAEMIKTRLASAESWCAKCCCATSSYAEYAKGLEGTEQDIKLKEVKIAELEVDAQKARDVKKAESQAQVRVLQAKAEADAMQYTLPLKEKQIEQTKLEAQARKESTLQNAEAAAQAKIIDSKAELERQHNCYRRCRFRTHEV